ncbi:MAG: TadA family conjugal transfer-associated ATPase [Propionibacteriaceae bacterium]|nr:TadA family conjugal transfer-associated ATPase [Propionibacteriaceae bacterium]
MNELDEIRDYLSRNHVQMGPVEVSQALRNMGQLVTDARVRSLVGALRQDSIGAGILDPLLDLPGVTDVIVNGPQQVYFDRGKGLELSDVSFNDDAAVRRLAIRLAASIGRRLDEGSPFVDARLPNGVRVHAILGSLTDCGTCLSLRIPPQIQLTLPDWVMNETMSKSAAILLDRLVEKRLAFLVTGGTGSGKTTLLSTLLGQVDSNERIVIVEDSRELDPRHPHCIRLESRTANTEGTGKITMTDLVRQALRMRPDRVVVGEVRGGELVDLLTALNTGHEGGAGTVHANSASDVPARLEALAGLGGMRSDTLHSQLAAALDVFIHIRRLAGGRRWVEEVAVIESSAGRCQVVPAVRFFPDGRTQREAGFSRLEKLVA